MFSLVTVFVQIVSSDKDLRKTTKYEEFNAYFIVDCNE